MRQLIVKLKELDRLKMSALLIAMSLFCFMLSMLRFFVTETKVFLFLNWNLFLAFIPWLASSIIVIRGKHNKFSIGALIFIWLIFFPNSPYILTDLMHLRTVYSAPIWFDLTLILSFAWTGLMFGFVSLVDIEEQLSKFISNKIITLISILFLFISSFGIYLGRFLRWNSWDIITEPFGLFNDIFESFLYPLDHSRIWELTILMGLLLNMMYFSIKAFKK